MSLLYIPSAHCGHHMAISLLQLVTLLPAPASQGDAGGAGSSIPSTARHQPVLGVARPGGGERRHCAGEGDTRGSEHLH